MHSDRSPADTSETVSENLVGPMDESLDTELGEAYEGNSWENELSIIRGISKHQSDVLTRDHPVAPVPRDVHKRSHGCLYGYFQVDNANLPTALKTGVFSENGKTFKVWSRFSNNNQSTTLPDSFPDIRGLGLKLMGVEGKKILPFESNLKTQDFLFLGTPKFFIKDNASYADFLKAFTSNLHPLWLAKNDPLGLKSIAEDQVNVTYKYTNPLDVPYFSATAYRLGARQNPDRAAIKYGLTRVKCMGESEFFKPEVSRTDGKYMRAALKQSMSNGDACFDFSIQIRQKGIFQTMPIEDSSIEWPSHPTKKSSYAEYVRVASVRFPAQEFDTDERNMFCENLHFTPWHSLPEHRPLGRINRARKMIYQVLSSQRQKGNGIKVYKEPEDFTTDAF